MDQRLKEALEYSNYRLSLATHKKNIRLRAEAIQLVSDSGGMFRANEQVILWLDFLIRSGTSQYVLIDINDQPVMVKDLPALKDRLYDAYTKSMNLMHAENDKIKRVRDVAKVVNAPADTENKSKDEEAGNTKAA